MNSTKANKATPKIKNFFDRELMPLAKTLQIEGISFFRLGTDPDAHTYYVDRHKMTMSHKAFEVEEYDSVNKLEQALIELWKSQGYPKLAALAPALSALAQLCRSVELKEEQKGEVSSSMYVLF